MENGYGIRKKPYMTLLLIVANTAVFLLLSLGGMTEDAEYMLRHGAMYVPALVEQKQYYQLFTSMFLHFGFSHLVNNMLVLFVVGEYMEEELGGVRYLILYLASGLSGNILSALWDIHIQSYAVSAGASGAVFGLLGALLYFAVRRHGRIGSLSGKRILFMVVLSLYYGFSSGGVDNAAHIGGLAAGFLLAVWFYWEGQRKDRADIWR